LKRKEVDSDAEKENDNTQVNIRLPSRPITAVHNSDKGFESVEHSPTASHVKFLLRGEEMRRSGAESVKIGLLNKSSELSERGRTFKHITAQVEVRSSLDAPALQKITETVRSRSP
jgi:hypothetical protein